jgi:hypothetical protein
MGYGGPPSCGYGEASPSIPLPSALFILSGSEGVRMNRMDLGGGKERESKSGGACLTCALAILWCH